MSWGLVRRLAYPSCTVARESVGAAIPLMAHRMVLAHRLRRMGSVPSSALPTNTRVDPALELDGAALLDPHTSAELSIDDIRKLCDELIEAHGSWLPAYH